MADVAAPVTGTVWKIETQEGAEVLEGQTLLVLESMKMEIPVEAPGPGRVKKLHVSEGQAVDEGSPLVTLE
jgi:acetyl-CoA carboxylase biotin carboxyl carrier protein